VKNTLHNACKRPETVYPLGKFPNEDPFFFLDATFRYDMCHTALDSLFDDSTHPSEVAGCDQAQNYKVEDFCMHYISSLVNRPPLS
jgi:hypothetical protein